MTGKVSQKALFRQGIRHGIPIALGYLSVSFTCALAASTINENSKNK